MSNLCPKCLKDDQVQKVSAIIAGGTFRTTYQVPAQGEIAGHKFYGSVQQTGTGITELAERLNVDFSRQKPLTKSQLEHEYQEANPPPKNLTISSLIETVAFIMWPVSFIIFVYVPFYVLSQIFADDFSQYAIGVVAYSCVGSFIVFYILMTIAGNLRPQELKEWFKRRTEFVSNREKEEEENIRSAKRKYSNMYYCHRDDVVFVPDETNWANSSEITDFVFR